MNRQLYRLVLDRRRGMRIAVAECARSCGKRAASGATLVVAAASVLAATPAAPARPPVVFSGAQASQRPAPAADLPRPYGTVFKPNGTPVNATPRAFVYDPAKGANSADLSKTGQVSWTVDGQTATFDQGNAARVVINWDSFDIGSGYTVNFKQNKDPSVYVSALNRIWSADPSVILGSLKADREVILLNANGIYFGRGARVDTGRFVASALNIADSVFEKGLRNVTDGSAVFQAAGSGGYAATNPNAGIGIEAGAEIASAAGGDVLLFAPRVVNEGRIASPQGQAVLAAGDKVYLMSSSDPKQRGLIVAVDPVKDAQGLPDATLGIVENAARGGTEGLVDRINEIRAESGSVNLVGLTVRQNGVVNATTAVKGANGAIYLQAMASTTTIPVKDFAAALRGITIEPGSQVTLPATLGTVELGAGSVTAVRPAAGGATQIDAEVFNPSRIRIEGAAIAVGSGAQVVAPGGGVSLVAAQAVPGTPNALFYPGSENPASADDSRIVVAPGAVISAAGEQGVEVAGDRNQGSLRLFRIELADAPVQRSGPLYRAQVYFDLRDGSQVSLANLAGAAASVGRTARERAAAGGTVDLLTAGSVVLGQGSTLDVSGGSVAYTAATLQQSVLAQNGRLLGFRSGLGASAVQGLAALTQQLRSPAYTEGAAGGTLRISGRNLALGGTLLGRTLLGERQRDGRSSAAAPATLRLGEGVGGSQYQLRSLQLVPDAPAAPDAALFTAPLTADLSGIGSGLRLSLAQVAAGGFGALRLRAGEVTQPAFGTLDLGVGGSLDIAANRLSLDGAFAAPGGRIALATTVGEGSSSGSDLRLSAASVLDAAGRFTNDTRADGGGERAAVNGGSVSVASAASLFVEAGATLDVSGGARLAAGGSLSTGKAGALTLATGRDESGPLPTLKLDGARLRGFDFGSGGQLTLGVPSLMIGGSDAGAAAFTLAPSFFGRSGFGSIQVNALGDVRIASGAEIAPRLLNWELAPGWRFAPGGAMTLEVVAPARVNEALVTPAPVNLGFAAQRSLLRGGARVVVERGATIALDAGASLMLSASDSVVVGATGGTAGQATRLSAPGGQITLATTGSRGVNGDETGFVPTQAVWLGADAQVAVHGVALLRPDGSARAFADPGAEPAQATQPDQRQTGAVLGGGTIALNAARGYVVAEAGSVLSLDGAVADVNIAGRAAPVRQGASAGTLRVSSPEGFLLASSVSARAPTGPDGRPVADGGTLDLAVGRGGVLGAPVGLPSYPDAPRTLVVGGNGPGALGARPGDDLSRTPLGNGQGFVPAALLTGAGFGSVALAAGDRLRFGSSLNIALTQQLALEAPAIAAAPGVQVELQAAQARLGEQAVPVRSGAPDARAEADASPLQDTALTVRAGTVEVVGPLGFKGYSTVHLDASGPAQGEIRFSTRSPDFNVADRRQGQLAFAGTLQLDAAQIFATTGVEYTLRGLSDATSGTAPGGSVVIRGAGGGLPRPPLSVLGSLAIRAGDIDQGGVLRQPFGRIDLAATRRLRLGDNSLTSVSGDGLSAVYGESTNLALWKAGGLQQLDALPVDKGITLSAPQIVTVPSARVDASGGGSLLAWEFFPGVGGSRDVLTTDGLYAVLPDYAASAALSVDGSLLAQAEARQFVVTMAGSGLAPGRYTLLPARQALLGGSLPGGAFLVSRAANQGSSELRAPLNQDDGSVVVTGYFSSAGSVLEGAPGQRFVVQPMATFAARSDIRLTEVGQLLATRATALGNPAPVLPRDAGALRIGLGGSAGGPVAGPQGSRWTAALDLAGRGGRAGTLDVDAARIALLGATAEPAPDALVLDAGVVSSSGAGSVLLGGTRSRVADAEPGTWRIDVSQAREVRVDSAGQALAAEELLLAARERVTVAEGTRIEATGSATQGARTLQSAGDGALVAVSQNRLTFERATSTGAAGSVALGAGARLAGAQVLVDASASIGSGTGLQLSADAIALGARELVIGTGAPAAGGTPLDGGLLTQLRAAKELSLRGYDGIAFAGAQDWSQRDAQGAPTVVQQRLLLDTPQLRGMADAAGRPAAVDISAQALVLRNSGAAATAAPAGSGSLLLQALPPLRAGTTGGLTVGPGAAQLGFDNAQLRSGGDLVLAGAGGLHAQNDLTLAAARLTAASAAEQTVTAGGTLHIAAQAGSRTLGERVGQGASVSLAGATVQQDGRVDLPGGLLTFNATGAAADAAAVSFGSGSVTSVAGFALTPRDGFTAYGTAGRIDVQAARGRIEVQGSLDASAAAAGDAGRIALTAPGDGGELRIGAQGQLSARAGQAAGDQGGTLVVDVQRMPSADALAQAAAAGGVTGRLALRARSGDVELQRGVTAQRIEIAADGGALTVGSTGAALLDAHAPAGGVVQLAAQGDVVLGAQARIDARSSRSDANGGDVLLASSVGRLRLDAAATIDAGGENAQVGRIVLRAQRDDARRDVRIDRLSPGNLRAAEVDIEAVRVYEGVQTLAALGDFDGQLSQATVRRGNDAFMAGKAALLSRLGVAGAAQVNLRAGTEVRSAGDLTVPDDWQFAGTAALPNRDRPGGDAGFLTLRAAGNLLLSGSLLDGFTAAGALNDNQRSWSFRLVGGADLTGANPLTTVNLAAGDGEIGNVVLDAGKRARTGAGSIEIAAGRDVRFTDPGDGTSAGSVVVAGRKLAQTAELLNTLFRNQQATPAFTEQGGRLEVSAQRDVTAPEATQLVGNWLWRSGLLSTVSDQTGLYAANSQLAWWTQQALFGQTLGSMGGGGLRVEAGRDVVNVQAMAPSAGWADSRVAAQARVQVVDGGDVTVNAGRDLLGGQFLLGRGEGRLDAGRRIALAEANLVVPQPLLALQDGTWRTTARAGTVLDLPFDPTAAAAAPGGRSTASPSFWTWGAGSGLKVTSNTGAVRLGGGLPSNVLVQLGLDGNNRSAEVSYQVLAPSLEVTAAGGAVELAFAGGGLLYPSPSARLRVWAGTDLVSPATASLVMSASAASIWGPASVPLTPFGLAPLLQAALADQLPLTNLHAGDAEPALLHAEGSVRVSGGDPTLATLMLPKPAQVTAGQDIVELSLRAQNLEASDVTRIAAGRNLLAGVLGRVEVAGPGLLEVAAGGSIDLGSSAGLLTSGNLRNGALPQAGASIRATAARAGTLDLAALDAQFLRPAADGGSERYQQYRDALVAFVAGELKQDGLGYAAARAAFGGFDAATQARFGQQVLAAEFGAVYLAGSVPTPAQFTDALRVDFERRKAQVLQAGADALAGGGKLTLPGRQDLEGAALAAYLGQLRGLAFTSLNLDSVVAHRVASLQAAKDGWRAAVAGSLGLRIDEIDRLVQQSPSDPRALAFTRALTTYSGAPFERYRAEVLARETASAGAEASNFGVRSLPARQALFDQGFLAAELAGAGSFAAQPVWSAARAPLFSYSGALDMTQSSVVTNRGGDISLVNAGGAINVGLKKAEGAKGVIALGGGNVFGYAKSDFQVNDQRVLIVGIGNMTIWSSAGDIDSGRGANTAVAAPPLQARRSVDGVRFEIPPTTTGSGLGIVENALGVRSGTIGLYPAFGEILALDAFIRAPALVLGATVKGADNLIASSVGGAAAAVSVPALNVAPPPANAADTRAAEAQGSVRQGEARQRPSLLTVELLGIGSATEEPPCEEREAVTGRCLRPAPRK